MFSFEVFPKIPRLNRTVTVTEKIDGTNAQILVIEKKEFIANEHDPNHPESNEFYEGRWRDALDKEGAIPFTYSDGTEFILRAGSRNRWLTQKSDNYQFWEWVNNNKEELFKLGPGRHFGEWFGLDIQRRYGLNERRFALFNVGRWNQKSVPSCCHVVPIVAVGQDIEGFSIIDSAIERLRIEGSLVSPGFMEPEGVVVFHHASRNLYKVTLEGDGVPKSQVKVA